MTARVSNDVINVEEATRDAAIAQMTAVLRENWPDIHKSFDEAYDMTAATDRTAFKLNVPCGIELKKKEGDIAVKASVKYGVTRKAVSEGETVSTHPELPLEE